MPNFFAFILNLCITKLEGIPLQAFLQGTNMNGGPAMCESLGNNRRIRHISPCPHHADKSTEETDKEVGDGNTTFRLPGIR